MCLKTHLFSNLWIYSLILKPIHVFSQFLRKPIHAFSQWFAFSREKKAKNLQIVWRRDILINQAQCQKMSKIRGLTLIHNNFARKERKIFVKSYQAGTNTRLFFPRCLWSKKKALEFKPWRCCNYWFIFFTFQIMTAQAERICFLFLLPSWFVTSEKRTLLVKVPSKLGY